MLVCHPYLKPFVIFCAFGLNDDITNTNVVQTITPDASNVYSLFSHLISKNILITSCYASVLSKCQYFERICKYYSYFSQIY